MTTQTAFAHPQRDAEYPAIPMAQIARKAVVHGVEQIPDEELAQLTARLTACPSAQLPAAWLLQVARSELARRGLINPHLSTLASKAAQRTQCNYTNPDGLLCLNDAEVDGRCSLHPIHPERT